jgi:hypothetical protein
MLNHPYQTGKRLWMALKGWRLQVLRGKDQGVEDSVFLDVEQADLIRSQVYW